MSSPTQANGPQPMRSWDYISLIWEIPILVCSVALSLLIRCCWPYHSLYRLHWRQKLPLTAMNAIATKLSRRVQDHLISLREPSGPQIVVYCAAHGIAHRQVDVPLPEHPEFPSPSLHILTPSDANPDGPTLFYAHGGGYQSPIRAAGHMPFVLHMAKACRAARVVFLAYSYTPATRYPGQFVQGVEGLRYLIEEGCDASDIILAGDSAGAHLIAGVLLHARSPAPRLSPLDLHGKRFRAAVLISPWLRMDEWRKEARINERFDFLSASQMQHFTDLFGPDKDHAWACPMEAPGAKSLWAKAVGESGVVDRLLVTAGNAELFFDTCVSFVEDYVGGQAVIIHHGAKPTDVKASIGGARAVLAIGRKEVHVQPALDASMGYYSGGTMKAIACFLETVS